MMAQVNKADPLPYSRTFQVDTYAVVKVHFWPNQQHGMHAAIITNHGCWIADLASNPGAKPSESIFPMSLLVHASCIHATTIHILDDISIHESMCTGVTCLNGIFWRAALLQCSSYMYVMSLLTMLAVTFNPPLFRLIECSSLLQGAAQWQRWTRQYESPTSAAAAGQQSNAGCL